MAGQRFVMNQLMRQAQEMQTQMARAQEQLAHETVEASAGGGLVTVKATGAGDLISISIDPKAVDPDDVETLEDLVLAAIHNAAEAGRALTEQKMGPLAGGLGLGF